ncbi:MAG: gamma-glutamyltransferase [Deltaproteobacteria bacterium]|nr:gamma-glutamyltransferase [Deltaproteobacteria bacterium]
MAQFYRGIWLTILVVALASCHPPLQRDAPQGIVVAPHILASRLGIDILQAGGNAVDAAVATGLALGVVDQYNSGLGGGVYLVIAMADGRTVAIDGRETAPLAAHASLFVTNGTSDPERSRTGVLAVAVPGALAGYASALERFGTMPLAPIAHRVAALARSGFVIDPSYAQKLASVAETLRADPESTPYFHPDGRPLQGGDRLIQKDLAATLEGVARDGLHYFYHGPVASQLDTLMRENRGILTKEDLHRYQPVVTPPVTGHYHGYTVLGIPPSSSGGLHVIQVLGMLERLGEPATSTALASALGFAFHDRARYLGDPAFGLVPTEQLIAAPYLDQLAVRARQGERPGPTRDAHESDARHDTAGFVVIDRAGNGVAATASINTTFGAKRIIPRTGIVLNNEMDDFVTQPGGENIYGLTGNTANQIAPGKRPLSSMAPTILKSPDGTIRLLLAAAGGPMIISSVVQTIERVIARSQPLSAAIGAPRLHHQWQPETVFLEPEYPLWGPTTQPHSGAEGEAPAASPLEGAT